MQIFFNILGRSSEFEKNLFLLTKANLQIPDEQTMKNILSTFAGYDKQTRAQIAFAAVIKKIHILTSIDNWKYILKNLIILDRIISENRFCQELRLTKFFTIQNYQQIENTTKVNYFGKFLKNYWSLIKMKCEMKISKSHILYYKRSERKTYLQNLKAHDILKQIQMLQSIFDSCINLLFVACGSINGSQQNQRRTQIFIQNKDQSYKEFTESKLVQYLTLNFYSKLLTLFSCQYLLIHRFIQIMLHIAKASSQIMTFEVKQFKKFIYQFKTNCQNMIFMAEVNRNKKGFEQIQTKEFSTFSDDHILKVIDEYIDHHQNDQNLKQAHSKFQTLINVNKYGRNILKQIMVDKKPLKFDKNFRMTNSPRLPKKIEIKNEQITAFSSYFNNYSVSFPHKNMMSIDLIEDIRGLERRRRRSSYLRKQAAQQFPVQVNLLKKLNQERSTLEWGDIIVLTNDKDQEVQTRGSSKQLENRESFGSLDDLFHNKWIFSKTTTNIN